MRPVFVAHEHHRAGNPGIGEGSGVMSGAARDLLVRQAKALCGALEPLQGFMTNPAGSAIVNAIGPIRQVVQGADEIPRRYLVIVPGTAGDHGAAVQVSNRSNGTHFAERRLRLPE